MALNSEVTSNKFFQFPVSSVVQSFSRSLSFSICQIIKAVFKTHFVNVLKCFQNMTQARKDMVALNTLTLLMRDS